MINQERKGKPEVNTFSASSGDIKLQVEDFRYGTGLDQRWVVTIELGERVLKVVVPGGNSGEVKIFNSSEPAARNIVVKKHLPGTGGSKHPEPPSQETPYFDEWVQSVFARRITRAG